MKQLNVEIKTVEKMNTFSWIIKIKKRKNRKVEERLPKEMKEKQNQER